MFTSPRLGALALSALLIACNGTADPQPGHDTDTPSEAGSLIQSDLQRDTSPQVPEADLATQVEANTAFAFDLYRKISAEKGGENLIYSPYSVSLALAMTYAGARGQTEADMAETLHFALAQDELHPVFNALDLALESRGQGASGQDGEPFRLNVANSIWGQEGFGFKDPFLDTLALNYGAGLRALDFDNEAEASRKIINGWVEDETEDRIKDLLPEGSITPSTVLVLTNAIYFNAAWESTFPDHATTDGDFTLADGSKVTTPLMTQLSSFPHASLDDVEAIELPYDGGEVSMLVLVPEDMASLEAALTTERLAEIDAALSLKSVQLTLPRFEVESTVPLKEILVEMGMGSAFDRADFTGIADADLAISDVFHKAFVKLDEEGTEAAAATAVVVGETSAPVADIVLRVDRPFLYLIRDIETGTVLFVGRVLDPTA